MIPYYSFESFQIGIFKFYVWGSFLSLALLVGMICVFACTQKIGWPKIKTVNLILSIYIGALLGARFFYFLQPGIKASWRLFFDFNQGGLTFYGGLFGGILAGWFYLKKQGNWPKLLDVFAPIVLFSLAIGRVGCFLINDHQGAETHFSWAIRWPDGTLRHPVALYLIIFDLLLFIFLHFYAKRAKWPGQVFWLFLFIYSLGRFFLDFMREPSVDPRYFNLAASQWISLVLLTLSVSYLILKKGKIRTGISSF
ncbi:MAG: prolipoprotein diacylglyceryl transferase [Candidatus Portnoybacteria bacterium]|nr:prolipoprotein diacylglyceryl transferase [Candidatus Portnoybacteria bacterium]